jgi:GNAT superfamily N-acetyltransferase
MLPPELRWRWELGIWDTWEGFKFLVPPNVPIPIEAIPFMECPRTPLEGYDSLEFQLGVSTCSSTVDIHTLRNALPDLQGTGQKDRRSGVVVLAGDEIVANYVIAGNRYHQNFRIVVRDDYKRRGLATRMLLEWHKVTPTQLNRSKQRMNPWAVPTFLSGIHAAYAWAVDQGKEVPDNVLREMETKEETTRILELLDEVKATGKPAIVGG